MSTICNKYLRDICINSQCGEFHPKNKDISDYKFENNNSSHLESDINDAIVKTHVFNTLKWESDRYIENSAIDYQCNSLKLNIKGYTLTIYNISKFIICEFEGSGKFEEIKCNSVKNMIKGILGFINKERELQNIRDKWQLFLGTLA